MAISFIPEIWSALMLTTLKKNLVYAQPGVVNRDYEGDIANAGDTVRIRSLSRPTIGTYSKGSTTITPEQLTDAARPVHRPVEVPRSSSTTSTPPSPSVAS